MEFTDKQKKLLLLLKDEFSKNQSEILTLKDIFILANKKYPKLFKEQEEVVTIISLFLSTTEYFLDDNTLSEMRIRLNRNGLLFNFENEVKIQTNKKISEYVWRIIPIIISLAAFLVSIFK